MLDIKFIRENPDLIKDAVRRKRSSFDVDALIKADDERREALKDFEEAKAMQNKVSDEIAKISDPEEKQKKIAEMKEYKAGVEEKEAKVKEVIGVWQRLMLQVPNVPDISVPEGESDEDNKEVRVVGTKPEFDFEPLDHITILEKNDWADFERGSKVAGFRGYFLKGAMVELSFAIFQSFLNDLIAKGYTPMMVPSLVKKELLMGTGYIPGGEEDLYQTQDGDYLAGTGEVAGMGYYMDEVLPKEKVPTKFAAFSTCFRREAGSHGKDVKGLIRVHEFFKLEQIILCEASHEESVKYHEEVTKNAEDFVESLGLYYHVVANCGADLGLGQVKKYDIEVWMPSQQKFRETHSASYFHDFQTRRLNIRYRDDEGSMRFAHSINNTAVATPRFLATIIEQYQTKDGRVRVPEKLKPFIGREFL